MGGRNSLVDKSINMDSTDSVVMGGQKKRDTLAEMPRFGGRNVRDGEVFPVWLKELTKKVKFDVGDRP